MHRTIIANSPQEARGRVLGAGSGMKKPACTGSFGVNRQELIAGSVAFAQVSAGVCGSCRVSSTARGAGLSRVARALGWDLGNAELGPLRQSSSFLSQQPDTKGWQRQPEQDYGLFIV